MWKITESRHVEDQWVISRRFLWLFWIPVDVRTGLDRAVEHMRACKTGYEIKQFFANH